MRDERKHKRKCQRYVHVQPNVHHRFVLDVGAGALHEFRLAAEQRKQLTPRFRLRRRQFSRDIPQLVKRVLRRIFRVGADQLTPNRAANAGFFAGIEDNVANFIGELSPHLDAFVIEFGNLRKHTTQCRATAIFGINRG